MASLVSYTGAVQRRTSLQPKSSSAFLHTCWQLPSCICCLSPIYCPKTQSTGHDHCAPCSGKADSLMEEIPTALVDKLPLGLDQGFVVLNRPYGFLQWVRQHLPHLIEAYVLMIEPDYIFMRPPPLFATPTQSAAYHFTYMLPNQNRDIIEPYNEKGVPYDTILPIGAPLAIADPAGSICAHSL